MTQTRVWVEPGTRLATSASMTLSAILIVFLYVVLACVLAGLAMWVLGQFTKDPVTKIGRVVIVVLLVIVLFWMVVSFIGMPEFPVHEGVRHRL